MSKKRSTKNTKFYTKDTTLCSLCFIVSFVLLYTNNIFSQTTERVYLSGTGKDNTANWQFFCTAGMNSGKWTTIPVPSCWELQGFGKYDYGFAKDEVRGKEKGLYKYSFNVPLSWKNKVIKIVFEGVMTDAEVKINGQLAGDIHQGAFYAFKYDITRLLKYGESNLLEVTVAKHSANESVNAAERRADFWIFGGIFRPVWLEVLPATHFNSISIDARADGNFNAWLTATDGNTLFDVAVDILDDKGVLLKRIKAKNLNDNAWDTFLIQQKFSNPKLWSPEFPNLYKAVFTISHGGKVLHSITQKFGFRTVEVRQRDGIYINGVKVKMKGVNRHSFWPTSGRTLSKKISIEDVLFIKDMNMNAVRMSHYPPDDHFLDACDSLGLFVMDELAGWHGHYDTPTGKKLVKEMMEHDVNHPCIIFWSNGNEGGHNTKLDDLFKQLDIQGRPVLHPWQLFGGFETQHYREYNYGIGNYEHGRDIIMPTEFLHGLYDGGHGAGLEDYWEAMWKNPLSAGGFLWDFADEGVVRKDKNDSIDTDGNHGADGIMGPFHEKEGSYYAIKEIWSPVYFERKEITDAFDGKLNIENRYHFTNLKQCSFSWRLVGLNYGNSDAFFTNSTTVSPNIKPGDKGVLQLNLPASWKRYDVLYITAKDVFKREIFTWSFPITQPVKMAASLVKKEGNGEVNINETDSLFYVNINGVNLGINKKNGLLVEVKNAKGIIPFNNGPVLQEAENNFKNLKYRFEGKNLLIESVFDRKNNYNSLQWTIYPSGWIRLEVKYFPAAYFTNFVGVNFSFPENEIKSVAYIGNGPYRVWKNRMKGTQFGVWSKQYNNTETGEYPWLYPEFKGYYSDFYSGYFFTKNNQFTVITETEDVFLRLFTPAWKTDQWHNYEPIFPNGDISFMQGIPAIGTKTQRAETTGPMGMKNIFYDYEKDPSRALKLVLYFNFNPQTP
ncbi:MAG TPA: glycoside hydrolase family 2 TIM barrel-domain containing protein [Chitinophagaceae bacterium]|nr:glycoside hydrolase family 2 TIM barrel-domain containing protein [Chitinophagaceae bacterium]